MNHVIVVDDSSQFVLHVWRHVSRSIGFGIGTLRPEEERWIQPHKAVPCDDGSTAVWWVRADGSFREDLEIVAESTRADDAARFLAVVDVNRGRHIEYNHLDAERELYRVLGEDRVARVTFVSAYAQKVGKQRTNAWPKTRQTLAHFTSWARDEAARPSDVSRPESAHVLVTGAGFEIAEERGGIGLPPTKHILKQMGPPFVRDNAQGRQVCLDVGVDGFPRPASGVWQHDDGDWAVAIDVPSDREMLDDYWDLLLKGEGTYWSNALGPGSRSGTDRDYEAWAHERRLREAFRSSIIRYDWGHLKQCLFAAQGDWFSWLSTNYTRFADRAIDLVHRTQPQKWKIVSTSPDADEVKRSSQSHPDRGSHLFKLHGAIEHLHTMAIATSDKKTSSHLRYMVESVHKVYDRAELYLTRRLRREQKKVVVWHIVGHGLLDQRLLALLKHVVDGVRTRHEFRVIGPDAESVKRRLARNLTPARELDIRHRNERAVTYLQRCATAGLVSALDG